MPSQKLTWKHAQQQQINWSSTSEANAKKTHIRCRAGCVYQAATRGIMTLESQTNKQHSLIDGPGILLAAE
jgi:hypothetical protein